MDNVKLDNFKPFVGQHCETTAIGNLLQYEGLTISEPMLFGIASGLGFIYWQMKNMPVPFLGGRTKELVSKIGSRLGIELDIRETGSVKRAWENVEQTLAAGHPLGLQLDCYHLEYFSNKIHFAGHHVAMYGYDQQDALLSDTAPQGGLAKTSLDSLRLARSENGPMSARNKSYSVVSIPEHVDIKPAIIAGIQENAEEYLNPPMGIMGYKGILKASTEIGNWLQERDDPPAAFRHTAMMMERAGTGGALFRTIYSKFLAEAYEQLPLKALEQGSIAFEQIAAKWSAVAALFVEYADTQTEAKIHEAAEILAWLSPAEKEAVEGLAKGMESVC